MSERAVVLVATLTVGVSVAAIVLWTQRSHISIGKAAVTLAGVALGGGLCVALLYAVGDSALTRGIAAAAAVGAAILGIRLTRDPPAGAGLLASAGFWWLLIAGWILLALVSILVPPDA